MNQSPPDVVVIGGGMAGVAAALASAARGARVLLIRRAPGATALCMGGWQGPLVAPLATQFEAVGHPWPTSMAPLPASDGAWRRYDRAAPAQAATRFGETTLVCGIAGLPAFPAATLARLWRESAGVQIEWRSIQLADTPAAGWSATALAATLSRAPGPLAREIARCVAETRATTCIVPPVLGLDPDDDVRIAIQDTAAVPVGETLGFIPSIPGWRLNLALERMLQRAGVTVLTGAARASASSGRRLSRLVVESANGTQQIDAAAFVLATGKYVGGGISAQDRLRENTLDCPVWVEHAGEVFQQAEPLTLTNNDRREEQPLLAAGVTVDAEDRPSQRDGEPVFENVWAAGAVRRGYDAQSRGLGHAAAEGWAAGERASA